MMGSDRDEARWPAWVRPALCGSLSLLLFVAFFALKLTPARMGSPQFPQFAAVLPAEFNFWLGHVLLATPAAALSAVALHGPITRLLRAAWRPIEAASSRDAWLALSMLVALFAAFAAVGRDLVLSHVSVVDDEEALRFGGQILASGRVFADDTPGLLRNTFELFLFWKGTTVASFDLLGAVGVHALAELTGLRSHLFAILGAVPLAAVAFAARQEFGRRGAAVAVVVLATAPMFVALSMTCHSHVASRAFIAVAYALFAAGLPTGGWKIGAALGLVIGCSVITRPPETTCLLAPFVLYTAWLARRSAAHRSMIAGMLLGGLAPVAAMLWHNSALTGSALTFARNMKSDAVSIVFPRHSEATRFANQIGHNGMVLLIFSFGLVGAAVAALGTPRSRFSALLAAGIACVFAIGLLHQDYGVHIVGPMHQSESVVPLSLLATFGLFGVARRIGDASPIRITALAGGTIVLGSLAFLSVHVPELHTYTRAHHEITRFLVEGTNAAPDHKVVVIAPHYLRVMHSVPSYKEAGTWQSGWSRPRPDLSDELIVLTVEPDPSVLTVPRETLPMSPEASRATPMTGAPIGAAEYHHNREFLRTAEAALAGRINARFPDRAIYKLVLQPPAALVRIK